MKIQENTFICGDCMEVMKDLPDGFADLVLTDPPYGIGIANSAEIGYRGFNVFSPKAWDNATPDLEAINLLRRIGKNQIVWGGNYLGLKSRCWLVWDKGEGFYNRSYAEVELAFTSFDRNAKIFKRDPLACGDYHGKYHPTQKPVTLFEWCLANYSAPGDLIVDPYCGSGTTALACHKTGRRFICIDKEPEYIAIAERRYKELIAQGNLFSEEARQDKGSRETAYNKPQPKMAEQMNLLESATSGDRSGDK